jgi:hypothetical protein
MWEKLRRQFDRSNRSGELYYATHHHLVPLYVLVGICMLAILVMASYLTVAWQGGQREAWRSVSQMVIDANKNVYLAATVVPAEKKQYVYSANVRFPIDNPYDQLKYSFDAGTGASRTSSSIGISTDWALRELEAPIMNNPEKAFDYVPTLQQCSKLYVIRFEAGSLPEGGFAPLQDIRLKDGRTAYIHKNVSCVPKSTATMNEQDKLEAVLKAVESF